MRGTDLSAPQRRCLATLAEIIVPRTEAMPSAGDLDLCGEAVDQVLRVRPDLGAPLAALLEKTAALAPENAVSWLAAQDPLAFSVLMQVVAGAYYMHPVVWQLLDYPGQEAIAAEGVQHPDAHALPSWQS
jgi:hypothetical protein